MPGEQLAALSLSPATYSASLEGGSHGPKESDRVPIKCNSPSHHISVVSSEGAGREVHGDDAFGQGGG